MKGDVLKDVPAQARRFGGPLIAALGRGQRWNLGRQVLAQLERGDGRKLNLLVEDSADLPRRRLGACERRVEDHDVEEHEKRRQLYYQTGFHDPSRVFSSQHSSFDKRGAIMPSFVSLGERFFAGLQRGHLVSPSHQALGRRGSKARGSAIH